MQYRRSDYDVTNTVQVSSPDAVRRAVVDLFRHSWPHYPLDRVDTAFRDFERLFNGQFPTRSITTSSILWTARSPSRG
jgi:hypothetical protein